MGKYNKKVLAGIYKRITGAMSGLAEINVEVHPQVVPNFNPKSKTIQMPETIPYAETDEEDFKYGRGICVHEDSHVLFAPNITKELNVLNNEQKRDFADWFNVFVDVNNEYKVSRVFPHLKKPLAEKTEALVEKHPEKLLTDNPFIQVLMRCDKVANLKAEFPKNYPDNLKTFVEETVAEFEKDKIHSAKGSEVVRFTKKTFNRWNKSKENYKNPANSGDLQELMKQLGKAIMDGDGDKEKDINDKIDKAGKGKGWYSDEIDRRIVRDSQGNGEYSEEDIAKLQKIVKKAQMDKAKNMVGSPAWGDSNVEIPEIKRIRPEINNSRTIPAIDEQSAYHEGKQVNRELRKKVLLQEDFERRHRSGQLDMEEIRKQVAQCGRIIKPTIFERKNTFTRGGDWAISILIDCSGSMGIHKMQEAKQALATLAYALDGLPNVKYELTGFTESKQPVDLIIKEFTERKLNMENLTRLHADYGNCDGINLRAAVNRILKYKNQKKIIIVISDGQPAYHWKGKTGIEDMTELVKRIEDMRIKVIGIGIEGCQQEILAQMYPEHYYFHNTKDLDRELTALILKALSQNYDKVRLVKKSW